MKALRILMLLLLTVVFAVCTHKVDNKFYSDLCGLLTVFFGALTVFDMFNLLLEKD